MHMYVKDEFVGLSVEGSPNGVDEPGAFIPAAAGNESVGADDGAPVRAGEMHLVHRVIAVAVWSGPIGVAIIRHDQQRLAPSLGTPMARDELDERIIKHPCRIPACPSRNCDREGAKSRAQAYERERCANGSTIHVNTDIDLATTNHSRAFDHGMNGGTCLVYFFLIFRSNKGRDRIAHVIFFITFGHRAFTAGKRVLTAHPSARMATGR